MPSEEGDGVRRQNVNSRAHAHYPYFLEFGHPAFKVLDRRIQKKPRVFMTHLPADSPYLSVTALARARARVVYMTRDPAACTLSAYHFAHNKKRKLREPSMRDIVRQEWEAECMIFGGWHRHAASWCDSVRSDLNITFFTYEEVSGLPFSSSSLSSLLLPSPPSSHDLPGGQRAGALRLVALGLPTSRRRRAGRGSRSARAGDHQAQSGQRVS